ncbi:MAG: hypothetical protein WAN36_12345, partial [Calditrichia bacterium]
EISYQICIHCNQPTPTHSHLHSFSTDSLKKRLREAGLIPLKTTKNLNKVMNRLHITYYFQFLPFPLWKFFDSLFNRLFDKPTSIIIICKKQV